MVVENASHSENALPFAEIPHQMLPRQLCKSIRMRGTRFCGLILRRDPREAENLARTREKKARFLRALLNPPQKNQHRIHGHLKNIPLKARRVLQLARTGQMVNFIRAARLQHRSDTIPVVKWQRDISAPARGANNPPSRGLQLLAKPITRLTARSRNQRRARIWTREGGNHLQWRTRNLNPEPAAPPRTISGHLSAPPLVLQKKILLT